MHLQRCTDASKLSITLPSQYMQLFSPRAVLPCRLAAQEMLQQYSDVVRWTLLVAGGYECQEQEGNYMIAFHTAASALEWALLLQEALMEVNWSNEVGGN
jgi:hypothetical protein